MTWVPERSPARHMFDRRLRIYPTEFGEPLIEDRFSGR